MTMNGHYALHCTKHASSFGAYNENLNEDRPALSAAKTQISRNVSFVLTFAGVFRGEGASNDSEVIENVDFQCF